MQNPPVSPRDSSTPLRSAQNDCHERNARRSACPTIFGRVELQQWMSDMIRGRIERRAEDCPPYQSACVGVSLVGRVTPVRAAA